jgi:hypothetical protein
VTRSSPAVFNEAVDDVVEYLRSSGIVFANDPLLDPSRRIIRTQGEMSRDDLLAAAKIAGATHLLLITVDRPISQWMKITVQCYDLAGKLVWQEIAGHTGSFDLNGNKALPDVMNKLSQRLQARIGKIGLPLPSETQPPKEQKAAAEPPAVAIQPPAQEVPGNAAVAATWPDSETKSSFAKCEEAKVTFKPLLPYILRADKLAKINYETEADFWSTLVASYPNAVKTLNSCYAAASAAGEWKEAAQAGIILSAVEKLRGDALGWATNRQLKESEAVRKDVLAYIGQTQNQALGTARYVGQLEGALSQLQAQARKQESYRNFTDTLLLLKALTPPPAPQVIVQPRAVIPQPLSRSMSCTAQPAVTGQTFINCNSF